MKTLWNQVRLISKKRHFAAFLLSFLVSAVSSSILSFPDFSLAMGSGKKTECSPEALARPYLHEEEIEACAPEWLAEKVERRKIINDPSRQTPPWLSDLADRFSLVANGLRLLKDKLEIDRWVGDPWTLRPDTRAGLELMGAKFKINMNSFLSSNLHHLFRNEELDRVPPRSGESAPPTNLYASEQSTLTFVLDEEITKQLPNALVLKTLKNSLTEEQLIDLAVYVLSKAPFFPKKDDPDAKEKWEKIKHDIYYYDLYMILAAAAATSLTNTAQGSISGWLFKVNGDSMRVGWIGKFRKVGISGDGKIEAGVKAETESLKASVTYYKDFADSARQEIRAAFISQWFRQFFEEYQWNTSGGLNASYILEDHSNPAVKGVTSVGGTVYLHKSHLFNAHGPAFTGSGGVSYSTNGTLGGSASVILEDKRNSFSLSANLSSGDVGRPDGSVARETKGIFLGTWRPRGGIDKVAKYLRIDANSIQEDLEIIAKAKQSLAEAYSERTKESAEFWLESRRLSLGDHLEEYYRDRQEFLSLQNPEDPNLDSMDPVLLAQAQAEIKLSIFDSIKDPKARELARESFLRRRSKLVFRSSGN